MIKFHGVKETIAAFKDIFNECQDRTECYAEITLDNCFENKLHIKTKPMNSTLIFMISKDEVRLINGEVDEIILQKL